MLEDTDSIVNGILTVMKYLNIRETIIGIENNKPDAISLLTEKPPLIKIYPLCLCPQATRRAQKRY